MKRTYQIDKQQAAERFRQWTRSGGAPDVALVIPAHEIAELAQASLGDLVRAIGRMFIETVMESEVAQLVGTRCKRNRQRDACRWGSETGYCLIDGQRVPIARPRVRSRQHNKEIPLGSYEVFQRGSLIEETVWHKIMHGSTMRSYKEVVQQFADAYGLEKTTTWEHFIEASRQKLEQLMTRNLSELPLAVIVIDGTVFQGESMMAAIGIDRTGHKLVLGLRQGATENAAVVGQLLGELSERGVDFTEPRLYLIDGSKAIRKAIGDYAGQAAFFQRCQEHKIRNVVEHLPEPQRHAVRFRMRAAYQMDAVPDAKQVLYKLHDELLAVNPSAAASLDEGLEETLTLIELRLPLKLRRSLSSTNCIELGFSIVDRICRQVKRWQGSDHRLRWVGSSLLYAESRWNRICGYRSMTVLTNALDSAYQLRINKQTTVTVA